MQKENLFWSLYLLGFDGSWLNVVRHNPLSIFIALCSLAFSIASLYAFQLLTTAISLGMVPIWHALLLIVVLLSPNITQILNDVFKGQLQQRKNDMFVKFMTSITNSFFGAPMDIQMKHTVSDQFDALADIIWVHDRTTQLVITTAASVARSIVISFYVIFGNLVLLPILAVSYFIALYFIIPMLYDDKKKHESSEPLWHKFYAAVTNAKYMTLNPCVVPLFPPDDVVNKCLDIFVHFGKRNAKWERSQCILSIFQNINVAIIIAILWYYGNYAMILIVLLNRDSFFSVVTEYADMINTGKRAERSLEKYAKIRNAINDSLTKCGVITYPKILNQLAWLDLNGLQFTLEPPTNPNNDETPHDIEMSKSDERQRRVFNFDKFYIDLTIQQFIFLLAPSGGGKSELLRCINGFASASYNLTVGHTNGTHENGKFHDFLYQRHFLGQDASESRKFNTKLRGCFADFLPSNIEIAYIRHVLIHFFDLNPNVVPNTITEQFSTTWSDGEIQRVVVFIDCVLGMARAAANSATGRFAWYTVDEGDKAIDSKTAEKIAEWIIMQHAFKCPIFWISHSPVFLLNLLEMKNEFGKKIGCSALCYKQGINPNVTDIVVVKSPPRDMVMQSCDDHKQDI